MIVECNKTETSNSRVSAEGDGLSNDIQHYSKDSKTKNNEAFYIQDTAYKYIANGKAIRGWKIKLKTRGSHKANVNDHSGKMSVIKQDKCAVIYSCCVFVMPSFGQQREGKCCFRHMSEVSWPVPACLSSRSTGTRSYVRNAVLGWYTSVIIHSLHTETNTHYKHRGLV